MIRYAAFVVLMITLATAQGQSNYKQALEMGDEAFQAGQYKTAINKYFAAEAFDPSKKEVIKAKVSQVFDRIEKLRGAAEQAQKIAEDAKKQALIEKGKALAANKEVTNTSDAFRLMLLAKQEASKDPTIALRIAEAALKKHKEPLIASVADEIFSQNEFYTKKSLDNLVQKPFRCAAVSPDGTKIATGSDDNMVRLWTIDGSLIKEFKGHRQPIIAICFSPNGKQILSGGYDNNAILWNIADSVKKIFQGHHESIRAVAFSRDGSKILTAGYEHKVLLWDAAGSSTNFLREYPMTEAVSGIAFTADGSHILIGTQQHAWKYKTDGSGKEEIPVAVTGGFFFEETETIISGTKNDTVGLFTLRGDLIMAYKTNTGNNFSLAFDPRGDDILIGLENGGVMILNGDGYLKKTFSSNATAILALAYSKDGEGFYAWSKDNAVRYWQTEKSLDLSYALQKGGESFYSFDFSPDGKLVLTMNTENTAELWNISGKRLHRFADVQGALHSIEFAAGGNGIITRSTDSVTVLWSLAGQKLAQFSGKVASFSADGKNILAGSNNGMVHLLGNTGQLQKEWKATDSGNVSMTAISPYDGTMYTGTDKTVISCWTKDGTLGHRIQLNDSILQIYARWGPGIVQSIIFSPDKINMFVTVAVPHSRGFVQKYFMVDTKKFVVKVVADLPYTFSADGSKLIYLHEPGVRVADVNGNQLEEYVIDDCRAASFSADEKKIITGTTNGIIKAWGKNMTLDEFLKSDKLDKLTSAQKKEFGITD